MRMEIHQRRVAGKIVVGGINTKVGIGDGGTRHVQRVNNLLKVGGRTIRGDLIGENGDELDEGEKSKTHCLFNQKETNESHD